MLNVFAVLNRSFDELASWKKYISKTMKKNWPNFYTAGVPKAGTTSLFAAYRDHPEIFTAAIKEPNYFNRQGIPDNAVIKPIRDERYYLKLYEGVTSEKRICDMSISLFEDPSSCQRILEVSPDAKIVICLRDQIERMFSLYLMLKRNGRLNGSFKEELHKGLNEKNYISGVPGMKLKKRLYAENLFFWLDMFPSDNIKVIFFEEFIVDQLRIVNEVFEFLDIKNINDTQFNTGVHNSYGEPRNILSQYVLKNIRSKKLYCLFPFFFRKFVRDKILLKKSDKPIMLEEDKLFLIDFFREDALVVQKILKRKLPWTNFLDIPSNSTVKEVEL